MEPSTRQSSMPYEAVLSFLIPARRSYLQTCPTQTKFGFKDNITWMFSAAKPGNDIERIVDMFKSQYRMCYNDVPDTVQDFKDHLIKNTYISQVYLLTKKIVRPSDTDPALIDSRGACILLEHINRTGIDTRSNGLTLRRVRFNFRTPFIDALFPDDKTGAGTAKVITPPFPINLYLSVFHTSCILGIGMFSPMEDDAVRRSKRRKRDARDQIADSSHSRIVEILDDNGDLQIPQIAPSTLPAQKFYRLSTIKSGKCTAKTLSLIVAKLIAGWDSLANLLSFRSAEVMLAPYITLNFDTLRYEVVPDNTLAPLSQLHTFTSESVQPVEPNPETCAEFAYVFYKNRNPASRISSQNVDPDKYLRDIANVFLIQVYKYCLASTYFEKSAIVVDKVREFEHSFAHTVSHCNVPNGIYDHVDMTKERHFNNLHNTLLAERAISDTSYLAHHSPTARHHRSSAAPPVVQRSTEDVQSDASGTASDATPPFSSSREQSVPPRLTPCQPTCQCNEARRSIADYIRQYSRMYRCHFDNLIETDETEGGLRAAPLRNSVQLILTDPPYNIRRKNNRSNSQYDSISQENMDKCVDTITDLLQPGGHVILFCTVLQFTKWYRLFNRVKDDTTGKPVYKVDDSPISCIPLPGHHGRQGSRMQFGLRNVCEYALHAYRTPEKDDGGSAQALNHVSYRTHGHVFSTHPGYCNVIDSIPRLSPGEKIIYVPSGSLLSAGDVSDDDGEDTPASGAPLRPEQKNVKLLRELISRFSAPGDTVVDLFAGTFSTAVAALTVPQHRFFAGCDLSGLCVKMGLERLADTFATLVYSEAQRTSASDLPVDPDIEKSVALYYEHVMEHKSAHLANAGKNAARWRPPEHLPLAQILPKHLAAAAAHVLQDSCNLQTVFPRSTGNVLQELYNTLETKSASTWPETLYLAFSEMDINLLRMADALSASVTVTTETPGCPVLIANKSFPKGSIIGYLNGTIVYRNLLTDIHTGKTKQYGSGVYAVTPEDFRKKALCILRRPSNKIRSAPGDIFLVPAPFCSLQYGMVKRSEHPSANAIVRNDLGTSSPSSATVLTVPSVLTVLAARSISRFDVIQIDYSSATI